MECKNINKNDLIMGFYRGPNIVTDGLVLHLDAANTKSIVSGSTTWLDRSGYGNNGTLVNGPTFNSANGGSIVFDGNNDYLNIGNPSSLNLYTSFTLSTWLRMPSSTVYQTILARGRGGAAWDGYEMGHNGHVSRVTAENAAGTVVTFNLTGNRIIDDGIWHYVLFSFNGTTGTMYVDAIPAGSANGYFSSNNNSNYIGRRLDGNYLSGSIATTQIYNRALSAQEVLQNYNATKSRFNL
jgi:hypothetical protein